MVLVEVKVIRVRDADEMVFVDLQQINKRKGTTPNQMFE
jgi:hypothetical protein